LHAPSPKPGRPPAYCAQMTTTPPGGSAPIGKAQRVAHVRLEHERAAQAHQFELAPNLLVRREDAHAARVSAACGELDERAHSGGIEPGKSGQIDHQLRPDRIVGVKLAAQASHRLARMLSVQAQHPPRARLLDRLSPGPRPQAYPASTACMPRCSDGPPPTPLQSRPRRPLPCDGARSSYGAHRRAGRSQPLRPNPPAGRPSWRSRAWRRNGSSTGSVRGGCAVSAPAPAP